MLTRIKKTHLAIILIVAAALVAVSYFSFIKKSLRTAEPTSSPTETAATSTTPAPTSSPADVFAPPNLNSIFGLDKKVAGTKIYYSYKLGVGFTYVTNTLGAAPNVAITEIDNKIYVHKINEAPETGQSIEVFPKDPKLTLAEAIQARFLKGYSASDCYTKTYGTSLPNYISAGIAYPTSTDPNNPNKNSDKCPAYYSDASAFQFVQFFLMNKEAPASFLFVRIGRDLIASDGTPEPHAYSWSHSIRILK